jgi:hypothetical protein
MNDDWNDTDSNPTEPPELSSVRGARQQEEATRRVLLAARDNVKDVVTKARASGWSVKDIQQAGGWKTPKSVYDLLDK